MRPARTGGVRVAHDRSAAALVCVAPGEDPALIEWFGALAKVLPARLAVGRGAAAFAAGARLAEWVGGRWRMNPSVVVLTSPAQWWMPRCFPRAVFFYYAVDNYAHGYGWTEAQVRSREGRIVPRCAHVVVVSTALADEMRRRHGLSSERIVVSPNALPAEMISSTPPARGKAGAPPVAGILGRVSSRLRLAWLRQVVDALPWLHWRFAGDVEERELRAADRGDLAWLRQHPRCHFVGRLPYRELVRQAAEVDVGVLPYSDRSINPWGSPMRLFMHLASGRPLLATPGCAQLREFEPLITICGDAAALIEQLEALRRRNFDDGLQAARLSAARQHTWELRAALMAGLVRDAARRVVQA